MPYHISPNGSAVGVSKEMHLCMEKIGKIYYDNSAILFGV